ncbi:hypothetical protein NDU88_000368, partial [Pleurodeles waltl]
CCVVYIMYTISWDSAVWIMSFILYHGTVLCCMLYYAFYSISWGSAVWFISFILFHGTVLFGLCHLYYIMGR